MPGRSMSMTATCASFARAIGTMSRPDATSATTSMSGSSRSRATSAPRTMCMSSATSTLITDASALTIPQNPS